MGSLSASSNSQTLIKALLGKIAAAVSVKVSGLQELTLSVGSVQNAKQPEICLANPEQLYKKRK